MKHLSPISFGMLKASIPDFYRCSIVKNTSFIDFFKQKLLTNLIIYFGQTKQAVKIANIIFGYLHSHGNGRRKILTGSFLLNTLSGDDINVCGDIDIITEVYNSYIECSFIEHFPLSVFQHVDVGVNADKRDSDLGSSISCDFKDPPCLGYNSDNALKDIMNIYIDGKKIQLLNIQENDQIEYINKFDLPICKNSYYDNLLKVHHLPQILKHCFNLNVSRTYFPRVICSDVNFVSESLCESIYKRLCRYQKRDYDIIVYTDTDIANISLKPKMNKGTSLYNDLKTISGHECDGSCVGPTIISDQCRVNALCEYVLKCEMIAVWREFWYRHTDDNCRIIPEEDLYSKPSKNKKPRIISLDSSAESD